MRVLVQLFVLFFVSSIGVYTLIFFQLRQTLRLQAVDFARLEVDLVITYVNDADPEWRQALSQAIAEHRGNLLPNAASQNRFRDNDDLRYLLRSVAMYGKIFRRIFLVVATESQVPHWLDFSDERFVLVCHREIFENLSDLPTFNSIAIEANLHRIEGLAEYFVYVNDDIAFLSETKLSHYVSELDRYSHVKSMKISKNPNIDVSGTPLSDLEKLPLDAHYLGSLIRSHQLMSDLINDGMCRNRTKTRILDLVRFGPMHTPHFLIRSVLHEAEKNTRIRDALRRTSSTKFRSGAEVQPGQIFGAFAACISDIEIESVIENRLIYIALDQSITSQRHLYLNLQQLEVFKRRISDMKRSMLKERFLCVNDISPSETTGFGRRFNYAVNRFRDELFPKPSPFEL